MGHLVAGFFGLISFVLLCCVLGDGRSLMTMSSEGMGEYSYRYGIGAYGDAYGFGWTNGDHIFEKYECEKHTERGQAVEMFTLMGMFFNSVAVLMNLLGSQSRRGTWGLVSVTTNGVLAVFMVIAFSLTASLFDENLKCTDGGNLRMYDSMNLNYGVAFFVIVCVLSIINIVTLVAMGAMSHVSIHTHTAEPVSQYPAAEYPVEGERK